MEGKGYKEVIHIYNNVLFRSVVLGMEDGSMTTLTIADPEKAGSTEYLKNLPSRNPPGCPNGPIPGIGTGYKQNGVEYPSPYNYAIYTDFLKDFEMCIPPASETTEEH